GPNLGRLERTGLRAKNRVPHVGHLQDRHPKIILPRARRFAPRGFRRFLRFRGFKVPLVRGSNGSAASKTTNREPRNSEPGEPAEPVEPPAAQRPDLWLPLRF